MAIRTRKKVGGESVELNMAAMLDMAFQLLTFFILTFRPAPMEGQINLRLPPPLSISGRSESPGKRSQADKVPPGLKTLVISVFAWPEDRANAGRIQSMRVEGTDVGTVEALAGHLENIFADDTNPFDQVLLQATGNLQYEELMRVVGECTSSRHTNLREKLKAIRFVEVSAD